MKLLLRSFVVTDMDPVETPTAANPQFEEAYKRHRQHVYNLCRYLLGSSDAAEDATHEVFLRAERRYSTYDPSRPLSSWLAGIASHYGIDCLRRRRTERLIFDADTMDDFQAVSPGLSPLGQLLNAERGAAVRDALAKLPDRYRVPLILAYYSELGYDEIAAVLGTGRNTVGTLIFRGKQQLRQHLSREK